MIKWIKIALVVLIALTGVNDIGRYLIGVYRVDDRTRTMCFQATQVAKDARSYNSGWPAVAKAAQEGGLKVLAYNQTAASVTVTAQIAVTGTWAIGPAIAIIGKKPLTTPFTIDRTVTTPIG
jgi:hypothetical protein